MAKPGLIYYVGESGLPSDATPLKPLSLEYSDLVSLAGTVSPTRETPAMRIYQAQLKEMTSGILSSLPISNDTSGTLSISPTRETAPIQGLTVSEDTETFTTSQTAALPGSTVSNDIAGTLFNPTTSGKQVHDNTTLHIP